MVSAKVLDEQVRRRQNSAEEPEHERRDEEGTDHDNNKDGQRRADEEPNEYDRRYVDSAERTNGHLGCYRGFPFEFLGV